jgi:hypothetical protein
MLFLFLISKPANCFAFDLGAFRQIHYLGNGFRFDAVSLLVL